MTKLVPSKESLGLDSPLILSVAAAVAFPDGSMTPSGLRKEAARGRLVIERIAGKDYTTLANINLMRELCRLEAKEPDCTSVKCDTKMENSPTNPRRSEAMLSPKDALRARLKQNRLREQSKP